jgi:methyl-accepting chemotaxis protein
MIRSRLSMTIGKKVLAGFLVMICLLAIVSGYSFFTMQEIFNHFKVIDETTEKNTFFLEKEIDHLIWVQNLDVSLLSGTAFEGQLDPTKCSLGSWLHSDEMENITDPQLKNLLESILPYHEQLHESAERIIAARLSGNEELALQIYQSSTLPALAKNREILNELRDRYQALTVETAGSAAEDLIGHVNSGKKVVAILGLVTLVLGIALAGLLGRNVNNQLKSISYTLNDSALQVETASNQLSSASQQIAEANTELAASIEETSATLEEASAMITQTTENTKQAALLAGQARAAADKGNAEMQEMVGSINQIKKSSDQIANIIKVIEEIAFQTNILSLNAAVEAARAGDAGMGFAVVAEEVRNLAQRSAEAAKDTAAIIHNNIELSNTGVAVSQKVAQALQDIIAQAQKVNELIAEVAAASQEQAVGIVQINKAIGQMEKAIQLNAATAEESAAASHEVNAQAQSLADIVQDLLEMVEGDSGKAQGEKMPRKPQEKQQLKALAPEPTRKAKQRPSPEEVIPLEEDAQDF